MIYCRFPGDFVWFPLDPECSAGHFAAVTVAITCTAYVDHDHDHDT